MIDPKANPDRLFTTKQVGEYFDVVPRTVCNWITEGNLEAIRPGGKYLVSGQSIIEKLRRSKYVVY